MVGLLTHLMLVNGLLSFFDLLHSKNPSGVIVLAIISKNDAWWTVCSLSGVMGCGGGGSKAQSWTVHMWLAVIL